MKYSYSIVWILVLWVSAVSAQQPVFTRQPALGVHVCLLDFKGADSLAAFGKKTTTGLAISYQNDYTPRLGWSVSLAGTFLDFINRRNKSLGEGKNQLLLEVEAAARYRILPYSARWNPYVQAGLGGSSYNGYYGAFIPAGLGLQVNISPGIFIQLNTQYRLPVTVTQHNHFYHSLGFVGVIGKKKVVAHKPPPVLTPVSRSAVARDTDGDGLVDSLDACPTVAGDARYKGCPVPDTDGDGIKDDVDQCPTVRGVALYHGCPAPEKDSAGTARQLRAVARHILFATGKYTLLPSSYAALDTVVNILLHDIGVQLKIEGHTDNVGGHEKNQVLSGQRAKAVVDYLVLHGIDAHRLQAVGYGQDHPVAGNQTSEGRALNRRVELIISYKE